MTRLTEKDIAGIGSEITGYKQEFFKKVGKTLAEIACSAAGISLDSFYEAAGSYRIAVIPVTAGEGVIGGFVHSVQNIIKSLGFSVSVTEKTDVSGLYEAVAGGNEIVFLADDDKFMALNLRNKKVADNGEATGKGYAAALSSMAGDLAEREVLVLGYGPVGVHAADFLLELGAKVAVYDLDAAKKDQIKRTGKFNMENDLKKALPNYRYLLDATPGEAFISLADLHPEVIIAAPGMPLGLDAEAYERYKARVIHDPLQIGVVTMLALALNTSISQYPVKEPGSLTPQ
jgi:pyrrolysine biosynthesis protein PylD